MIQHKWFRVEQAHDGSILSCTEVPAKGLKGGTVRFYAAADASAACALAKVWYERHIELSRDRNSSARERAANAGRCTVCRSRDARPGMVTCQECADAKSAAQITRRERHNSGDTRDLRRNPGGAPAIMAQKFANDAAYREGTRREAGGGSGAVAYLRILRKLDELSPGEAVAFRAWLVSKIPAMRQTQGEWHPPLVEPQPQAAE